MKKILFVCSALFLCAPFLASAHQHGTFTFGGSTYSFVVGSLNEPVAVDDKTGVDLTVTKGAGTPTMSADGDMDGMPKSSTPVTGLEKTLQVELSAGGKTKVLALSPAYGKPGSYTAPFYPTVATSLSYRFFGTIDGTKVNITFVCRPEGATAIDEGQKDLGGGVMQVSKMGGFGCPMDKASMGFPEQSASVISLSSDSNSARTYSYAGIVLGAVALVFGLMCRRSN